SFIDDMFGTHYREDHGKTEKRRSGTKGRPLETNAINPRPRSDLFLTKQSVASTRYPRVYNKYPNENPFYERASSFQRGVWDKCVVSVCVCVCVCVWLFILFSFYSL
mgnify:CR=1